MITSRKICFTLFAYLGLAWIPLLGSSDPADPEDISAETAWEWISTYEYPAVLQALEWFEADLLREPDRPTSLAGVAASLAIGIGLTWDDRLETLERADRLSLQALGREPDRAEIQFARALVEILNLDFRGAEQRGRNALSMPGNPVLARLALGEALIRQGQWIEAEKVFRDTMKENGAGCPLSSGLAVALQEQEKFTDALQASQQAIDAFPDCLAARLTWTSTVHRARRTQSALQGQNQLYDRYPESRNLILLNAGAMYLKAGRCDSALNVYQRVKLGDGARYLKMFHDFGTAFCREQLGFQSEAETGYRNLVEGFPALQGGEYLKQRILYPAYKALAQLLWSIGRTGESILVLERASEEPDVPAGILRHLGDRYQELGLVDSADGAYERAARSGRFEDLYDEGRTIVRWIRSRADNPSGSTLASTDLSPLWDFQRRVDPGDDPGTLLALARALALGQQNRKSLHWLEMAVRAGYRNADILRRDPDFASIRDRKKFQRVLAQIEQDS